MTKEELTALKAVLHGCCSNRKIEDATYFNLTTKETMDYSEAAGIVLDMIEREKNDAAD